MTFPSSSLSRSLSSLFVACGLLATAHGAVSVIALTPTDRGWMSDTQSRDVGNINYLAGASDQAEHCDWFVFDLSGFAGAGDIINATLQLYLSSPYGTASPQGVETFALFDVSTNPEDLDVAGPSPLIYADLSSGVSYGSVNITSGDLGSIVDITLNADGLAALNAAKGGQFAIGGAVTTVEDPDLEEYAFGFSFGPMSDSQLVVTTVPESGSLALLGLGGALAFSRRRRSL